MSLVVMSEVIERQDKFESDKLGIHIKENSTAAALGWWGNHLLSREPILSTLCLEGKSNVYHESSLRGEGKVKSR